MELQQKLEKEARKMGAAYFGVADLSFASEGPVTPNEKKLVSQYPFAVSIGVPLSSAVVDGLADQSDAFACRNYWWHVYEMTNLLIDQVTLKTAHILMEKSYTAITVPCSQTSDPQNLRGMFSNKMAAHLAGHGWIGKSCLLVTPDRGPRVRWGTVLTDAPLAPGRPIEAGGCGDCNVCVEACPPHAFTGRPFHMTEPREVRMDVQKCYQHLFEVRRKEVGLNACGVCVYVCPFGRKASSARSEKHSARK